MPKLKLAVFGKGRFGSHYIRILNDRSDVELVDSIDSGTPADKLLNNPEIDAVVLATPASTHFNLAKQAILASKHVLVEKPMVLSVADAEGLAADVKKSNQVFMVGHQYVYNDHIRHLKKIIDEGSFGDIKQIAAEHLYPGPVREDVGAFWDAVPHELSIVDYLFGSLEIRQVTGKLSLGDDQRDDTVQAKVEFTSGLELTLKISRIAKEKVHTINFIGEKNKALYNDIDQEAKLKIGDPDLEKVMVQASEPLANQIDHFIDAIKNGSTPLTDIEHGVRVTKHLEQVFSTIK
ncbi:hypothetical protein CL634_06630 [bacterium]|nr:hypothetical protein [bacterium]|tara:strand:- start:652 stop:1527 length:876 start_codon:yes stop_codon:yes gene_type:complete